jgi:hypothetical protein
MVRDDPWNVNPFHPDAWGLMGLPEPDPPPEGAEEVLLRFTPPPPGGRSYNTHDGRWEPGVATYRAWKVGKNEYVIDYQRNAPLALTHVRMGHQHLPAYLIAPERVVGKGRGG